jgi:hypothetical protein
MFCNNKLTRLFTLLKEWESKNNYFVSVVKQVGEHDEFSRKKSNLCRDLVFMFLR